jgi:hypothetical protein
MELDRHLLLDGRRRAGADVPNPGVRRVQVLPAGPPHPRTEVGFLEVHEVACIERPDLLERLTADQQAGPEQVLGRERPRVAARGIAAVRAAIERDEGVEEAEQRLLPVREMERRVLVPPVRVLQPPADQAGPWVGVGECE